MLKWVLLFAAISLVSGMFGFTGLAATSADIASLLNGDLSALRPLAEALC